MSPSLHVRLLDGRELRVETDGVHVGERTHPLGRIEEARLLFLRPETVGLRMSDVGLVEYSVARPGDGGAVLNAIYALRPELRRADAPPPIPDAPSSYSAIPSAGEVVAAPASPAGGAAQPWAGGRPAGPFYPPQPLTPVTPPGPTPFPAAVLEAYGPTPNRTHAELTPAPRSAGQLIGGAFRLYGRRFGALAGLALVVAVIPAILVGALNVVVSALSGENPLAGVPNPLAGLGQLTSGQLPATTAPTATAASPVDNAIALLSLLGLALALVVAAWSYAALAIGAREATLGRRPRIGYCARLGLSRLWATLWALIALYFMLGIIAVPGLGFALGVLFAPLQPGAAAQLGSTGVVVAMALGVVIGVVTLVLLAYLWTRLALYPTAVALGMSQPIRVSLAYTTFGRWRVFWALLVVTVFASLFTIPANAAQLASLALATVILSPLAQLVAGPLGALIRVGTLYDQQLRREGYGLFLREGVVPPASGATPTESAGQARG